MIVPVQYVLCKNDFLLRSLDDDSFCKTVLKKNVVKRICTTDLRECCFDVIWKSENYVMLSYFLFSSVYEIITNEVMSLILILF